MAIRDQSYQRYDGPTREGSSWAVIAWHGFKTYWSFWRTKLTIFAIWLIPLVFFLLIIAEAALGLEGPTHAGLSLFIGTQLFALAVVFIARGCGIVSDDLRHGTLQLHFSKPITRVDYAAGKFLTLALLGVVAVLIPAVVLGGLRLAFLSQEAADFTAVLVVHVQALVLLGLVVAMLSALVMGLSSLTRRTGWVVLTWIGVLIVPTIIQGVVTGVAADPSPWFRMLSLSGLVHLAGDALMGGPAHMPDEIPRFVPFVAILGLIGAGFGALRWRLTNLDRIT